MAYHFIQVDTVTCDNCGKEQHKVLTDRAEPYPDHIEWELFTEKLEKEGWIFGERALGDKVEAEVACCSEACFKTYVGEKPMKN